MNNRSSLLSNPLVLGIGGLVIGLLIGWFLLGWVLFPVQYTDAYIWDLNPAAQEQYVVTVADAFAADQNTTLAQERLRGLSPEAISQSLTAEFGKRNQKGDAAGAARISGFAQAMNIPLSATPPPGATPARTTPPARSPRRSCSTPSNHSYTRQAPTRPQTGTPGG